MSPKISIHVVAWNSMPFLLDCLASLEKQTYKDFQVLVIDNGSTDQVQISLQEKYPHVRCLRNMRNLGFSSAHNQGIRYALEHWDGEDLNEKFILVANPDVLFTPTYLEEIVGTFSEKESCGSFGGKILRAYGDHVVDEVLKETIQSDRIESAGLVFRKNYLFTNRGSGELDEQQYNEPKSVFGFSGVCVCYRASALQSVRYKDEFFDQDFFTYQEDIDLAFRLQYAGWQAWYVPKAVVYHYCGEYEQKRETFRAFLKERRNMSEKKRLLTVRNHWLFLFKNLDVVSCILSFPRLVFFVLSQIGFLLLFEQRTIAALCSILPLLPRCWLKRQTLTHHRIVSGYHIRKTLAE